MATGITKSSSAVCCWCQGPLVQVASTPGIWWCLTETCAKQQLAWAISRNVQHWERDTDGQNQLTTLWERLFVPTPRQVQYMDSPATYRLFGGAAGPGKSTAARMNLYRKCLAIPGYEALILRETFPELERTHLRRMGAEAEWFGADFVESKRVLKFANKSIIECGHMDDEAALRKYLSSEYDHIVADEGSNFDPMNLLELSTRARTSKPEVLAKGGAKFDVVSNPGGRAAKMLKDLFIDHVVDPEQYPILASADEQGRPFYDPQHWAYIPATLDDNPYIDPAYVRALAVLQPWRYEQLRRGDWNIFAGAFFSSWSSAQHVRSVPIHNPNTATWIRALDWGYHDPCVIGWFAVLPDGHYHCVAELKLKEHLVVDVVREVKAMDRTLGLPSPVSATRTYADPAVRQRGGQTGESILETFGKAGMPLIPSVNERQNGWMRVQALLKPAEDGVPFLTFDPACKYLTRSMAGAMSDPKEPDDLLQHDDHGLDMIRYFAMSRPMPRSPEAVQTPTDGMAGFLLTQAIRDSPDGGGMIDDTPDPTAPPLLPFEGPNTLEYWKNQIQASRDALQRLAGTRNWDQNIQAYLGMGDRSKWGRNTTLVRKDFSLVEGKKALLFFQTPDVSATANQPQYAEAAPLVAAVMNAYLSPAKTNAKAMVDEVLMDVLCPAGIGVSKIGYECHVNPQQREVPVMNPAMPGMPSIDPTTGAPVMQPNIVRESYFWQRIPPKMFLYPATFIGSDFDTASWLGFAYDLDKVVAERIFELAKEDVPAGSTVDQFKDLLASDVSRSIQEASQTKVKLYELWYRASDVDANIGDPQIIRQLVIMEGRETALIHRDSPYQTIQDGKVLNGMKGFPVHVLTLRYVSDQAIPPSDCSVSRDQIDELSRGRTQMIDQRDRAVPLTLYDTARIPTESMDKILAGVTQEFIGIPGMDGQSPPAVGIQRGQWPRENFSFNDVISRDIGEAWSLGNNQLGQDNDTRRTATELSLMQAATETRMDKERVRVLNWFAKGCEKLLALVQMFATDQDYVRMVGQDGLPALTAWDNSAIGGDFSITLAPDSSQRVDAATEKKRAVDVFQMLGNDPLIDPVELRKWLVRKLGMDQKLVKPPMPKPPEKPNVSVSLTGEDMNPLLPQYVNVTTLLAALGIGVQAAQPQGPPPAPGMQTNPGGVPPVSPIGKRFDESQSGQLPGAGQAPDAGGVTH